MIKSFRVVNLCLLLTYCLDNEYCDMIFGDGHGQGNSWLTYCWGNSEWLWFTVINDCDGQWNNVRFTLCHKPFPSLRVLALGIPLAKERRKMTARDGLVLGLQHYRRKFRSETSDNMDSWKAEVRRVRREKIRRKKMQVREKVGTSWNTESRDSLCFSNDLWLRRVEK